MNDEPVYSADEFESESRYISKLIWEAIVIEQGAKVLVCGYGPDGGYVQRAIDAGGDVTVIEHRAEAINHFRGLDAKLLRGSTSVIPAKDNTYDLAISYHYLHEIDPFFHAQVLAELARVARRVAVIEPAPPADPLGKRIALLYSQAKRELGQFEYYQPLEYWKKLLQGVKADVSQHVFAFAKVPPREYLRDTVKLMLDTIEIEDAPKQYMEELRSIAQRSDAALLPPPRFVLVGAAAGELIVPRFTQRVTKAITAKPSEAAAAIAKVAEKIAAVNAATPPAQAPAPRQYVGQQPAAPAEAAAPTETPVTPESGYEFPPVAPPAPTAAQPPTPQPVPAPPPQQPAAGFGFGAPSMPFAPPGAQAPAAPGLTPFGMPFAVPEGAPPNAPWAWEPPENSEEPQS